MSPYILGPIQSIGFPLTPATITTTYCSGCIHFIHRRSTNVRRAHSLEKRVCEHLKVV